MECTVYIPLEYAQGYFERGKSQNQMRISASHFPKVNAWYQLSGNGDQIIPEKNEHPSLHWVDFWLHEGAPKKYTQHTYFPLSLSR